MSRYPAGIDSPKGKRAARASATVPPAASPAPSSSRRRPARRSSSKKVNYRDHNGEGDDEDEDDAFSDPGQEDENDHDDDEDDDSDAEFFDKPSSFSPSSSRKRKSSSSSSSVKRAAAAKGNKQATKKRMVVDISDESEDDDGGGDVDADEKQRQGGGRRNSRHASSPRALSTGAATPKTGTKPKVVDLGDTSEDEVSPPPVPEKPSPAARAKLSPASKTADKSGSAKKSSGGGGGGFRPPWRGGERMAPPNEGNKEVPAGAEQCLAGKAFVVSGVLDSLGREAAEDLIKQYGGKVTGSVSSRTTYLLLGSVLDDGRPPEEGSKYKKAQQLKTKVIDEDGLFKMLRDSIPNGKSPPSGEGSSAATTASRKPLVSNPYGKAAAVNPYSIPKKPADGRGKPPFANPYGASPGAGGGGSGAKKSGTTSAAKARQVSSGEKPSDAPGQMWVDKYKPRASSEVMGQGGQVKKLKAWLEGWEKWHLGDSGVKPPQGKDNPGARAALLSGVPGVGKSSTGTLVAREMGYHVTELNASDTRNKSSLSVELASVIGNQVLPYSKKSAGDSKGGSGGLRKQLVIMDEVDGMGGSDRGGIQELISLIKKTKVPIIAICNDRQHPKIRSLVNYCYDLRFTRPAKATIAKRVKAIAKTEGMDVDDNAAEMLAEANGNDIRQVLHALQMWSRKSSKMTYMNLKGGLSSIEKDKMQRCGPFEAARLILGGRAPFSERFEAFFTDYSLLPLLVHQNYLSSLMKADPKSRAEVTASAAAAVSDADIISGKMRGDTQNWSLLPTQAAMNVRVGFVGGGSLGFPEFPKWLGNYSRENKRRRLLGELATHLNASISGGTEAVRLSYVHFLKTVLTQPLRDHGADGARSCIDLLQEYGLSRDDLFEVMPEFQLSSKGMKSPPLDVFASLDSKTKTAVTRGYNAISHKSQALVETMQAPKKAKKRKAPPKSLAMSEEGRDDDDEAAEGEEEREGDEDEEDLSAFRKKGKTRAPAANGKGKAAAKSRAKKRKH
ncbi:unnamed protein product [Ascophyllum nodosum]